MFQSPKFLLSQSSPAQSDGRQFYNSSHEHISSGSPSSRSKTYGLTALLKTGFRPTRRFFYSHLFVRFHPISCNHSPVSEISPTARVSSLCRRVIGILLRVSTNMSTISNAEYYTYFSMWSNTYCSRPRKDYVCRHKAGQADGRSDHQADQGDSARSIRGSREALKHAPAGFGRAG